MCGIVGLYHRSSRTGPVDAGLVLRARDRMSHRGPDGAGLWSGRDGRVVLGHRRLAIIDTRECAAQPMIDEEAGLTLVYNGEIYNHRELRRELEADGAVFRTESDTEVLLRLYARHGTAGLERINGMFAFALWDERRGGLLLARDGLGIKPLYVFEDGGVVGFSSEARALAAMLPERPRHQADPAAHIGFFLYGWVPEPFSFWSAIRMLPAGSWRWITDDGAREGRFFDVTEEIAAAEDLGPSPAYRRREETVAPLRDQTAAGVARHLIADVPVCLFLSAGVDSTMIAELAARAGGSLGAVTLGADRFVGTVNDEIPEAGAAARALAMPHHVRRLGDGDFADGLEPLLAAMDSPSVDGVNTFFIARAATASGFKAALSGAGGDEFLGGYPSFRHIPALVRFLGPAARLPGLGIGARRMTQAAFRAVTSPKYASLLELSGNHADAYLLRRGLFLPWELEGSMDAATLADGVAEVRAAMGGGGRYERIASPFLRVLAMETELYLRGQLLRDADWAGMASSLEIRTPLADVELLKTVARLAAGRSRPLGKPDLAPAVGPLSAAAARRPKTGFTLPIRDWLTASDGAPTGRGLRGWSRVVYEEWCRRNEVDAIVQVHGAKTGGLN